MDTKKWILTMQNKLLEIVEEYNAHRHITQLK